MSKKTLSEAVIENAARAEGQRLSAEDLAAILGVRPNSVHEAASRLRRAGRLKPSERQVTGAAQTMGATLNDNTTTAWTALQRQMQGVFIEQIGPQLLPILRGVIDTLGQYSPIILPVAAALAGLVGVVYAISGAMAVWRAAQAAATAATVIWGGVQTAFNAIMAINPFVLIIIGIGLLVAGIIWAYENVGWFRDGVNAAWAWIQATTTAVFGAVSSFFTSILIAVSSPPPGLPDALRPAGPPRHGAESPPLGPAGAPSAGYRRSRRSARSFPPSSSPGSRGRR